MSAQRKTLSAPAPAPAETCADNCEFCAQERQAKILAAARARPRPTEAVKRAVVEKIRQKLQTP